MVASSPRLCQASAHSWIIPVNVQKRQLPPRPQTPDPRPQIQEACSALLHCSWPSTMMCGFRADPYLPPGPCSAPQGDSTPCPCTPA